MTALPEPHDESPVLPEDWLDLVDGSARAPEPSRYEAEGAPQNSGAQQPGAEAPEGSPAERAALSRARQHARALRALPRREAPRELDGLVVAALHGGHREDRATAQIASLAAKPAPAPLRARVRHEVVSGPAPAPAALDRLVEVRVQAESLSARADAAGLAGTHPSDLRGRSVRQRLLTATAAGVALGTLLGLGGVLWAVADRGVSGGPPGGSAVAPRSASSAPADGGSFVEFIEVDVDDLSPADRALLSRLGGPLLGGRS